MSVMSWWLCLCAIAAFNIAAWYYSSRRLGRRRSEMSSAAYATRRWLLALSAVYVLGCAYRCVFLVYDVPRICLFDTPFSSILVGRTVATLAELSFVGQWALMLRESSGASGSVLGRVVSLMLVPLIALAEICSWFSILTTSNLGHVAEESIWGLSVTLLVACVVVTIPRSTAARRPILAAWCVAGLVYVAFMFAVDVPMYGARWIADESSGRHYLTLAHGLRDVSQRRVVSHRWADWKNEVAWMSSYFSVAVWISISFIYSPAVKPRVTSDPARLPATRAKLVIPS